MDSRRQIPAIALLGLSLTDCKTAEEATIVGTWTAIEVDMEKFPMVEMEGGSSGRYGYVLRVEDDLSGGFGYYGVYSEDGVNARTEQLFPITVDDDDAPHFLITVEMMYGGYYEDAVEPGVRSHGAPGLLRARPTPRAAGDTPVLDCQLKGDRLACTLTAPGDDDPVSYTFARKTEAT